MADLAYKFIGVNTAQLANEVRLLRQNSSTFRALEASAVAAGYTTIEVRMGAGLLKGEIADSGEINSSTWGMRINSDASGSWGAGGRQATVGEVIAHELAHAVVPQEFREPGRIDPGESGTKGMWVRRQAGQVALDLGLLGANNADHLITRIPINETQGCTVQRPQGDGPRDGVLFLDGSRGYNGIGSTVPPGSGSQDPINSRRLATDEPVQEFSPAGSDSPFPLRSLGRVTPPPMAASLENSRAFDNRFGNWGSSPVGIAPLPPPDRPASFDSRFGNWSTSPAGDTGSPRSPVLRALQKYERSAAPDDPASTSGIAARNRNQPPLAPAPLLGIFSGKPMSLSPFPLPLGGLRDNSDGSGDGNWFDFLTAPTSRNPTPPPPPSPTADSKPARILGCRIVGQPQASVSDTSAPAVQLAPSDAADFSGGHLGRLAALAGIDPQDPTQLAPPPLDDQLRGFYRDDPMQPWFVQRQR